MAGASTVSRSTSTVISRPGSACTAAINSSAAAAGIWEAGTFAEPVASGATLSFFEEENNASERWKAGTPTPEADNAAVTQTAVEPVPGEVPTRFLLRDNYPNPFNPSTTIPYEIDRGGHVTLSIYDLLGKKVIDLVDEEQPSGVYRATWDGRNNRGRVVATGVYVYRLTLGGEQSQASVMTLIK